MGQNNKKGTLFSAFLDDQLGKNPFFLAPDNPKEQEEEEIEQKFKKQVVLIIDLAEVAEGRGNTISNLGEIGIAISLCFLDKRINLCCYYKQLVAAEEIEFVPK